MASSVAPFTGAWIEIISAGGSAPSTMRSHPSRVRGLKYHEALDNDAFDFVAPFTGAWIEMRTASTRCGSKSRSHPSRVRGLKYPPIVS